MTRKRVKGRKRRGKRSRSRKTAASRRAPASVAPRGAGHGWPALVVVLLGVALIRLRLLAIPLERDEGDYAYIAQLLLQGIAPYTEAYEMRMPGIFAAYALVLSLFGETATGIHLGLLVVNAGTIALVFLLGRRLVDATTGLAAAVAYAALSTSPSIHGLVANTEHFLLLPALAGILLLLRALDRERSALLFPAGLLFGTAFLMKQHAALFAGLAGLIVLWTELRAPKLAWRRGLARLGLLAGGVLLPLGVTGLLFLALGDFERLWFWTVVYSSRYVGGVPLEQGIAQLGLNFPRAAGTTALFWLLGAMGLAALVADPRLRKRRFFLLGLLLASAAAVSVGFLFRRHYFLLVAPALALLVGIAVSRAGGLLGRALSPSRVRGVQVLLVTLPLLHFLHAERAVLFRLDPPSVARHLFGANPFPESVEIARYIEERTDVGERIAVVGSEPQIYFYARRRAATSHILTYPLMEKHEFARTMQEEMMEQIERAMPKYLVYVHVASSWMQRPGSETLILDWFPEFAKRSYTRVGLVDIVSTTDTRFYWDEAALGRAPRANNWLSIYVRR